MRYSRRNRPRGRGLAQAPSHRPGGGLLRNPQQGLSKQVRSAEGQKEQKVGLMAKVGLDRENQTKQKRLKVCQKRTVGVAGMVATQRWEHVEPGIWEAGKQKRATQESIFCETGRGL